MTDTLHYINIGGVCFSVTSDKIIQLKPTEPNYKPFLENHTSSLSPGKKAIVNHIKLGQMPELGKFKKLFDGENSWSLFKDEQNYYIASQPPGLKKPYWVARIDKGFTKTTIHYNEEAGENKNGKILFQNPIGYPLDQILLMYILAENQGAVFHCAGIELNGKGCLFLGKSGAGKSTITRQFLGKKNIALLSDDRMVVRKIDGEFKAFGTPWPGEERVALNRSMPLSALFFIHHGSENKIKKITPKEAVKRILPVASIPWYDSKFITPILKFCEDIITHIPTYDINFLPTPEVADDLEKHLSS